MIRLLPGASPAGAQAPSRSGATTFARRAWRDKKGVAAIEFAFIFPIIFVLIVAAAEGLQAYAVQRQVAHIASTMADITAQSRSVTDADLDDILSASGSMLYPFPLSGMQQRVSSASANSSAVAATDWTRNRNWLGAGNPDIPNGYLAANESVIIADVIYDYRPAFGLFFSDSIRITRHAYARPRLSAKVEKAAS